MDYGDRPLAYYRDQHGAHPIFASYVPNDIINGHFAFWQRGTSFAAIATGSYSADRWKYAKVGTMVHTISRSADVPGISPYDVNYSALIECTTADTDIAAGDLSLYRQFVEGFNFKKYVGNYGTLSFWVKATKPGIYCVAFSNTGADRSLVAEYTINSANVWEFKAITIQFNYSGGTWAYTTGSGIIVNWTLMAGSNFQTTSNAWQSGNYFATSNQVNACDTVGNLFQLAKVKFEPGRVTTPFVLPDFNTELARCQRYYEKSYDLETAPGAITSLGAVHYVDPLAAGCVTIFYKVRKRGVATMTFYSTATGASGKYRDETSGADFDISFLHRGEQTVRAVLATHGAADEVCVFHWTADAEL